MNKHIRIRFAVAYYGNSNIGQGTIDIPTGQGYKDNGFEITPDHKYIFVRPFAGMFDQTMSCTVAFKTSFLTKILNLLLGKPRQALRHKSIEVETKLLLKNVDSIGFSNDWDDSHYSFTKLKTPQRK